MTVKAKSVHIQESPRKKKQSDQRKGICSSEAFQPASTHRQSQHDLSVIFVSVQPLLQCSNGILRAEGETRLVRKLSHTFHSHQFSGKLQEAQLF